MVFNGSSISGLIIGIIAVLTTAFDFDDKIKYIFSALLILFSIIPLIINFIVFLNSPFSRWKHLKCEFYKLILSDSFERINIGWSLKGNGMYCNQSMIEKAILPPMFRHYIGFENPQSFSSSFEMTILHEDVSINFNNFGEGKEILGNLFCKVNGYNSIQGFEWFIDNYDVTIGSVKVFLGRGTEGKIWMRLEHYTGQEETIYSNLKDWESFLFIIYCMKIHELNPSCGVLSDKTVHRRGVCQTHTYSYQEIFYKLASNRSKLYLKIMDIGFIVCEGEVEIAQSICVNLPKEFDDKFGEENRYRFSIHHAKFWGKVNSPALHSAINHRTAIFRIGSNWKAKRYMVDLSYFLEKLGRPRFARISLKINPTRIAINCFGDCKELELNENFKSYKYVSEDPNKISTLKNDLRSIKDKSEREDCIKIINSHNVCERVLRKKVKGNKLKNAVKIFKESSQVIYKTKDISRDEIHECPTEMKEMPAIAENKTVNFYHALDTEVKGVAGEAIKNYMDALKTNIGTEDYIKSLKNTNMNWKRRSLVLSNFLNHSNEKNINFPIHPKTSEIKHLNNKIKKWSVHSKKRTNRSGKRAKKPICQYKISLKNTYEILEKLENDFTINSIDNKESEINEEEEKEKIVVPSNLKIFPAKRKAKLAKDLKRTRYIRNERKKLFKHNYMAKLDNDCKMAGYKLSKIRKSSVLKDFLFMKKMKIEMENIDKNREIAESPFKVPDKISLKLPGFLKGLKFDIGWSKERVYDNVEIIS